MKKFKKLLTKRPSKMTQAKLAGFVLALGGYAWARMSYDQNVANNNPNTLAGYLMVAGVAMLLGAYAYPKLKQRKKKSKKSKSRSAKKRTNKR